MIPIGASDALCARVLDRIADGTILIGTVSVLAKAFGVTGSNLRACLRELLQDRKIAVSAEALGHITIRPERRAAGSPGSISPRAFIERRGPTPEIPSL